MVKKIQNKSGVGSNPGQDNDGVLEEAEFEPVLVGERASIISRREAV